MEIFLNIEVVFSKERKNICCYFITSVSKEF
jgi:hypothetical protein